MSKKIPEISGYLGYNKCNKHKFIYISESLPCPYPNCKYGISEDSFIDKGFPHRDENDTIKYDYSSIYRRKEWKGIDGDLKYVWHSKKDLYPFIRNIIYDEMYKMVQDKFSDKIYHYTSIKTLHKILNSNELWLTEYSYTNDPTEIDYGIKILNELDKYNLNIENNIKSGHLNYFLASFSYEIEKRTLFNEYADNARGIAIEFDSTFNYNNNFWYYNSDFTRLMPVIYDKKIQKEIINYAFYIFEVSKKWLHDDEDIYSFKNKLISKKERKKLLHSSLASLIEEIISFFKDSSFSDEREIRWLYRYDKKFFQEHKIDSNIIKNEYEKNYYTSTDVNNMGYKAAYKSYDDEEIKMKLPIKKIILGSKVENKDEIINEIKNKLTECNFNDVFIEISNLPYK